MVHQADLIPLRQRGSCPSLTRRPVKGPLILMHLVHALFFVAAKYNFHVTITHIAGVDNSIADALSHFLMQKFHQLAPDADKEPTVAPTQLTLHSSTMMNDLIHNALAPSTRKVYLAGV